MPASKSREERPRRGLSPSLAAAAIALVLLAMGAATSSAAGAVFLARAVGGGGFECLMNDQPGPAYDQQVLCISNGYVPGTHKLLMQEVTLDPEGRVHTCVQRGLVNKQGCNFGNAGEGTPTYGAGKVVTVGRFTCRVQRRSVRCAVAATGTGFLLGVSKVTRLEGASASASPFRTYVACGLEREATPSHACRKGDLVGAFFTSPTDVTYEVCVDFPTKGRICMTSQTGTAGTLFVNQIRTADVAGSYNATWFVGGEEVGSWAFGLAADAKALVPKFGTSATVRAVSGTVLVKQPGGKSFIPLSVASRVPLGSVIDASGGTVQMTSAASPRGGTQSGRFSAGAFEVTQTKLRRGGRPQGLTVLSLVGELPRCGARGAAVSPRAGARRLWGDAHGNFKTGGRYASATVGGTRWLTEDSCAGTLVKVARGVVTVADFPHHRTVLVRAPHSFLSHPGPGG